MTPEISTLTEWIKESNNIVFFGGAGVSTESGIRDFRSSAESLRFMGPNDTICTEIVISGPTKS